jgi:polysaccharide biosynthesis protein PslG
MRSRFLHALLVVMLLSPAPTAIAGERAQQADPRFFAETGYRISNDQFWDYFQKRGGLRTFGYPASREMMLQGFTVQFFQRTVMQLGSNGVQTLNLLDGGLLPYTTINGSTFPSADPSVVQATPASNEPNYSAAVIEFTRQMAPDTWEGKPVNFFKTFSSTVTYQDAFPRGDGPAGLLPLINLEIWGTPTSKPARDPNNDNFVYLRFQRGIMHYDDTCQCTQGLLLADYLKALMTGENLPADLEAQASGSPLYKQYRPSASDGLARSRDLPQSDLKEAFEKQAPGQATVAAAPETPEQEPAAEPAPRASEQPSRRGQPYRARSPEYGMNVFLWGNAPTTERDLKMVSNAGFGWQKSLFQWKFIEPAKGQFDWEEADRIVAASKRADVKIIGRLDFQPAWARLDGAHNGPPDNYQDYADFVYAFVSRYSRDSKVGQVAAIEVWNEPNLAREWGNQPVGPAQAADYVRLLQVGYEAAKRADRGVVVITGGLSPTGTDNDEARPDDLYLQWMYDAGAKPYFDVLGAHGAGYKAPPTVAPDEAAGSPLYGGHRFFTFRRIEDLRNVMVANGDEGKQVWLLEFGWTSDPVNPAYAWHQVTEEQKAEYLVGAFQWAAQNWAPWIGVMTLWNLPDPGWGPDREEYWWSIANPDGTSRPAYDLLLKARKEKLLP